MAWTFVWMMLILKIPIAALLYLVWWAVHQTDEPEVVPDGGDGGSRTPRHPRPSLPRAPRRGAHGEPSPAPPRRTRTTVARARSSH